MKVFENTPLSDLYIIIDSSSSPFNLKDSTSVFALKKVVFGIKKKTKGSTALRVYFWINTRMGKFLKENIGPP